MNTELIHGSGVFDQLKDEWDALVDRSITDTPFQRWAYQRGWWQHLQPANASLETIIVREGGGELQAIACFYLLDGTLYFNGGTEETDYLDLIVPAEYAENAWTAIFNCLTSPGFPPWAEIDLCNIPDTSPTLQILSRIARRQDLPYSSDIHEVCPVIQLPNSFDTYLSQLDKKQRHEIRRKLRRAGGADLYVREASGDADFDATIDTFLTLLQKSTAEKADWLNEGRRAFFHEVARAAADAGMLQLLFIGVGDQPAAALFNFDYRGRIWVYNSGLDPEAFGHLSPGVVVTAKAIEQAIAEDRSVFDFLRGDEQYKYRFGAQDTTVHRIQIKRFDV